MKTKIWLLTFIFMACLGSQAMAASYADIGFVIDQSGSMYDEFAWLGTSIGTIDTNIAGDPDIDGVNYGLAGYERTAGFEPTASYYPDNAWQDLTADISLITAEVNSVSVYGGTENSYHAASWAADNFSWSGGAYAKVLVLITDEPGDDTSYPYGYSADYSYGGLTGEAALAQKMADNNILLNVITFQNYYQYWDDAVFVNPETSFAGLFDLSYLRTDAAGFTDDFTAAKLAEIEIVDPDPPVVPEPSTVLLLGSGLLGLFYVRRRAKK